MSHIVVTGKGIPTAASCRSVQGKTLSGERAGRQKATSAGNYRAFEAYSASKEMSAQRNAAVSVDIPDGAMRVSRQLWEEYGGYPEETSQKASAVGVDGQPKAGQTGTQLTTSGKLTDANNKEIVSGEIKEGEKTDGEVTEETQKEGKKGTTYGITEEGLDYLERLLEQMKESRKTSSNSKNQTKKVLNYNYRRISSAISRAKNVNQANNALTSANSNLNSLRRKAVSGKYKNSDLQIAMTHAKKMVRVARKKVSNIKYEDQIDERDNEIETDKERRNRQNLVVSKGNIIKRKEKQEKELRLLKKVLRQQRNQRKNAHRRGEEHDLINADMEYLRKKIELIRQERQENSMERMADYAAQESTMMAADAALQSGQTGGGMTAAEVVQNAPTAAAASGTTGTGSVSV